MKGSQGLEALAALCGGQTDAPTSEETRGIAGNGSGSGGVTGSPRGPGVHNQQPQDGALRQQAQGQNQLSMQHAALQSATQQQWQQALAALQGNAVNPALAAHSLLMSAGLSSHHSSLGDMGSAMQQLALHQYIQAQAQAKLASQSFGGQQGSGVDQSQALIMALAKQAQRPLHDTSQDKQQVIPSAANKQSQPPSAATSTATSTGTSSTSQTKIMKPPPPSQNAQTLPSTLSTAGILNRQGNGGAMPAIAPMPGGKTVPDTFDDSHVSSGHPSDKKQQKRAANRRSAQLSRKRKKQFIEELKEENDELRRKEQILRSIPDLIVVFDSSGKLGFVSQSVSRFLQLTPEELEGTSFWERLCEDSVRLLKAAFMDSLAARTADSDTAPLGSGVWELRLLDKDSSYTIVTLSGVVHFAGEAPECVCCIRPRDEKPIQRVTKKANGKVEKSAAAVSSSDGSRSSDDDKSRDQHLRIRVHPSQSVINSRASGDEGGSGEEANVPSEPHNKKARADAEGRSVGARGAVRISDGDSRSGSEVSESGSDDGVASS